MGNIYTNFEFIKLEFDKILHDISKYALSEKGKELIINSIPSSEHEKVIFLHKILEELTSFFVREESLGLGVIYNFSIQLENSKKNIIIDASSLYKLAFSLKLYFMLSKRFRKPSYPNLQTIFNVNELQSDFYIDILKYIDPEGYIDSKASVGLKDIRSKINGLENKIRKVTDVFYRQAKSSNYTSDSIISLRDGFLCVAIKSNYKNKVDGIVLDSSSTGHTVFIAPKQAIELHNDLIGYQDEEKKEIIRILKSYTEHIRENINELEIIDNDLLDFDVLYSKSKYSIDRELYSPEIIKERRIKILSGKHPLLDKNAVALDIEVGRDFNILVITGPNTGGKTVLLKTIGIFALMVQAGIPIPASSTSQFSVFNKIFVDIGDEQSIEQSLSTFSARVKKIIEIVKDSDENSLILIDEFGAGTDPVEGSALAISILETILKMRSLALMTTHYSALKHFASQVNGIENGSMEFDTEKLSPTYKLKIGVFGSSKALEISKRLGMPESILKRAKMNINKDYMNLEILTEKIEKEAKEIKSKKEKLTTEILEFKKREDEFLIEKRNIEKKEEELKVVLKSKESTFLTEARKEFENVIKLIRTKKASKTSIKKGKEFLDKIDKEVIVPKKAKKISEQIFNKGDNVLIVSKDIKGVVIDKTNVKDEYLIQAGLIKVNFHADDLRSIEVSKEKKASYSFAKDTKNIQMTLDLRGFRYEDAEKKLDKFMEESIMNKVSTIRIIHGKGTGVLRKCIHDYFDNSQFVLDYDYEKDINLTSTNYGVTIASLR